MKSENNTDNTAGSDCQATTCSGLRSQADIVAEIERIKDDDYFGFKRCDLIGYLDYDHAKKYLKPEVTEADWKPNPTDRESILKQMEDYMPFAWDKANNERSLSAGRSLAHFTAWVWMLGDEDRFGDLERYQHYGKDHLRALCDAYGWNADQWDDGRRVNERGYGAAGVTLRINQTGKFPPLPASTC